MSRLGLGLGLTKGGVIPFNPLSLDPYLLFDTQSSMIGTFENPTLDLDPSVPSTLDVITATRAGVATYTDADGLIQSASADTVRVDYTQGAELTPTKYQNIGYTDFSQDWTLEGSTLPESQTTAPDGSAPVYELTENTGTSRHRLYRGYPNVMTLVVGQDYTVSAYVKKVSSGRFFLINSSALNGIKGFLNLDTGVATLTSGTGTIAVTDEGNGWYRLSVTAQATTTNGFVYMQLQNAQTDVTYTGTGASMLIWGPQVEEGTTASSFVANTTGSPKFIASATYGPRVPMILVEPSSENLWNRSEGEINDYSFAYGTDYLTDDPTPYKGLSHWVSMAQNPSTPELVGLLLTVPIVVGNTYVLSAYIRMDDGGVPVVGSSSTGASSDLIMYISGSSTAGLNGGVEHIEGDLYRIYAVSTPTTTSASHLIRKHTNQSQRGFKISGLMLEESSVPTSYIPTSGGDAAARTRAADDLVITGSAFSDFYNQSEGTFYVESVPSENTVSAFLFDLTKISGGSERLLVYNTAGSQKVYLSTASTTWVDKIIGVRPAAGALSRGAISYETNNVEASLDGVNMVPDTSATMSTSIAKMTIGNRFENSFYFNGHIKRVLFWPTHSSRL